MNKEQAVNYMINEVKKIERERVDSRPNIESTREKKEVVEQILNKLKEVSIDDENKSDQI